MMRLASLALALASAALVIGLLAHPADRAAAEYNISGQWTFFVDGQPPCPAEITESKDEPLSELRLEVAFNCDPPTNVCGTGCTLVGSMNPFTGYFTFDIPSPALTIVSGTVTGEHSIGGSFYSYCFEGCIPGVVLTPFTATGGDGAPKLGTPTPCLDNCPTFTPTPTPGPVGGMAVDAPTQSGGAFDARWVVAMAGAAIVTLGGAALYALRWGRGR